ncbi:very short patch repair endonuclease [Bradyrhizobium elkanii]|uniref:very short patch repair endonuclease n=1 Tax=Bradyrhizobium elkanii TaxID=29448 RepID=UPI0035136D07
MSPATRSAVMARIRGKGTKPELAVAELLANAGLKWEEHCRDLPGRPDFVLRDLGIAIFVDGDFWHGWRFPAWRLKLSERWERKIEANIKRDIRNFRALRRSGWKVVRIWEHQIKKSPERCLEKILLVRTSRNLVDFRATWHGDPKRTVGNHVRKPRTKAKQRQLGAAIRRS